MLTRVAVVFAYALVLSASALPLLQAPGESWRLTCACYVSHTVSPSADAEILAAKADVPLPAPSSEPMIFRYIPTDGVSAGPANELSASHNRRRAIITPALMLGATYPGIHLCITFFLTLL